MTIQRGEFRVICDGCGCIEELETMEFDEAIEAAEIFMDENGWLTMHEKGKYKHICNTCR